MCVCVCVYSFFVFFNHISIIFIERFQFSFITHVMKFCALLCLYFFSFAFAFHLLKHKIISHFFWSFTYIKYFVVVIATISNFFSFFFLTYYNMMKENNSKIILLIEFIPLKSVQNRLCPKI